MKNIEAFKTFLGQPKRIVIVTHFKPDADALGSSLALQAFLIKKGHATTVITPSDYPDFLSWMYGSENVITVKSTSVLAPEKVVNLIGEADAIFCVDFSKLDRIHSLSNPVKNSRAVKVLIDHHLEPETFADFEKWDPKAASSAGLIFELICQLGDKGLIDENIANCLYAGLITDTRDFKNPNVRQKDFLIASELVGLGAVSSMVSYLIHNNNSQERLSLLGHALAQKLVVLPQYRTAYIALSLNELQKFGAQTGDTEELANYGLSIKGIKLSALLYDRSDAIKFSFRSVGDFSVNEFAKKHFNGGGHSNRAGGISNGSMDAALNEFVGVLYLYKDELTR